MINYDVVGFLAAASRGQPVFEFLWEMLVSIFYKALENILSFTPSIAISMKGKSLPFVNKGNADS